MHAQHNFTTDSKKASCTEAKWIQYSDLWTNTTETNVFLANEVLSLEFVNIHMLFVQYLFLNVWKIKK